MTFTVEYEQEDDGHWLAEVVELPGVLAYGGTYEFRPAADARRHADACCTSRAPLAMSNS